MVSDISFCYIIILFAYYKVYKIIRHHQQQIKASEVPTQRFGQNAINMEKYKRSVATRIYILLLFSVCFNTIYCSCSCRFYYTFESWNGHRESVCCACISIFFSQPRFVLLENEGYSGWSEATVNNTQIEEEIRTKFK